MPLLSPPSLTPPLRHMGRISSPAVDAALSARLPVQHAAPSFNRKSPAGPTRELLTAVPHVLQQQQQQRSTTSSPDGQREARGPAPWHRAAAGGDGDGDGDDGDAAASMAGLQGGNASDARSAAKPAAAGSRSSSGGGGGRTLILTGPAAAISSRLLAAVLALEKMCKYPRGSRWGECDA